jgi:hypothetical protein
VGADWIHLAQDGDQWLLVWGKNGADVSFRVKSTLVKRDFHTVMLIHKSNVAIHFSF